jgi:hypothetical protein
MLEKGNSYFFLQGVGSGGMNFLVKKGGANKTATTGETIDAGEWNHIVGVFDGENAIVYLNGEQKGSIAVPAPVDDAGLPLRIGSDDSGNFFDGSMDLGSLIRVLSNLLEALVLRPRHIKKTFSC